MATPRDEFIFGSLRLIFCDPKVFNATVTPTQVVNTFKAYCDGLEEAGVIFTSMGPGSGMLPINYEQTHFNAVMYATQTLTPASYATAKTRTAFMLGRIKGILDEFVAIGYVATPAP